MESHMNDTEYDMSNLNTAFILLKLTSHQFHFPISLSCNLREISLIKCFKSLPSSTKQYTK